MNHFIISSVGLLSLAAAVACGSPSGTQPHAMSAAEHATAADREAKTAQEHESQFDPSAAGQKCGRLKGERGFCWTSEQNPTADHERQAAHHRELSEKHRAGMAALQSAEARQCAGIPAEDRDSSPFSHREDIRSVTPLKEEVRVGKNTVQRTAGAEIVFTALPGLTAEWLQRVVDCHIARNSTIGHETTSAEMSFCPLTLRGVRAAVRSVGDGFAVAVRSDDEATSAEIVKRAESLAARGAP